MVQTAGFLKNNGCDAWLLDQDPLRCLQSRTWGSPPTQASLQRERCRRPTQRKKGAWDITAPRWDEHLCT